MLCEISNHGQQLCGVLVSTFRSSTFARSGLRIINYINETLSLAEVGWGQHARVSHKAISAEWLVFPIGGDNLL